MRSDGELVEAARRGDASAWNALVDRHSQCVFANARAVGADAALANDVCQLVWLRLVTRLDRIREPDRIRGWLAITARNTTRDQLRKRRPTDSLDSLLNLPAADPLPDHSALSAEDGRLLSRALTVIGGRCRELLVLLYSAEMSYEEISATTGMAIGSIGPTRQRCLDKLRAMLESEVH